MFNQDQFSNLLKQINATYDTMTDFAKNASFDRTYISKYINKKLTNPPTPKILEKIAKSSHGITTYEELMEICGYASKNINDFYNKSFIDIQKKLSNIGLSNEQIEKIYKLFNSMYIPNNEFQEQLKLLLDSIPSEKVEETYKIVNSFLEEQQNFLLKYENILKSFNSGVEKSSQNLINNYFFYIPILGKIAAGQPILVEEYIEGYLPIIPNMYGMTSSEDYFYLKVSGDSMNQRVQDGDYVLIHKQNYAEDGDIIVAIVNGDNEATLKKYKEINEQFIQLVPMSNNPIHEVKTIDLKTTTFLVIGKAIGNFGKF